MNDSKNILIGVSGGVAAYKVVEVASRLRKAGHVVQVAMTEAATRFVTPLTFAAVSGRGVLDRLFTPEPPDDLKSMYPHLYPATEADVFLAAPATADLMAQLAHGTGRDVVTASALSLRADCQRFYAPAMNMEMWEQPVVQRNDRLLQELGWCRIGPESGHLACGMTGPGRMTEPGAILARLEAALNAPAVLTGLRVLVLSGPTHEHLDPIRYIGNPSSGKMGRAIAEEAARLGAEVDFITGPVPEAHLPIGPRIHLQRIVSAQDLLAAATARYAGADIVVYVAAVADYTPVDYHPEKLPKSEGDLVLRLRSTPDVAATLNQAKRPGQVTIGFALQTHDGPKMAAEKLARKKFDGIVLNYPEALGGDQAGYQFLTAEGIQEWGRLDKRDCARRLLSLAAEKAGRGLPAAPPA